MMRRTWLLLGVLAASAACSTPPDEGSEEQSGSSIEFPFDGNAGKDDVFGRSLVGAPNPYAPNLNLSAQEEELRTNMRRRREVAWETAFKVLEPVPLLGLANALEARPECAEQVIVDDLKKCAKADQSACGGISSGGVDICAWDGAVCAPTCDALQLPDGQEVPTVPRFSSWYGVEDITRIFRYAYGGLEPDDRVARAPLSDLLIGEAFMDDHSAVERSNRWPLQRYTDAINELFECALPRLGNETDEEYAGRCTVARQSSFSGGAHPGGGVARLLYSPAMVMHMMRNYGEVLECRNDKLSDTWCGDGQPCADPQENFSRCFKAEFPVDGGNPFAALAAEDNLLGGVGELGGTVVIKATWARVGFGFDLPVYDTDGGTLRDKTGPGKLALWPEKGDRVIGPPEDLDNLPFPTPDDVYTVKTKSGSVYRLTGLHIMTKELRHWQWITLWWSDDPNSDFGADRPESFDSLPSPWRNYKMCAVTDYLEGDADAAGRFADLPTLQAALEATSFTGQPTWCSNPYIEKAAGNARTNCIGCHQHAGSRFAEGSETEPFDVDAIITNESPNLDVANRFPANGRIRRRSFFATDYSWAFSRLDDLTELIRTEVEFAGARDERWVRMNGILSAAGDAAAGEEVFRNTTAEQACTNCHGDNGEGAFGPSLSQVFATKTDWQALHTVINGRASMPAWGTTLTDKQLTDLFAYLSATFDTP